MKLNILSDLHLSVCALDAPSTDADAVILAGDIERPDEAIAWASALRKPVLYVPGNHEFYGGSIAGTRSALARCAAGTNVRLLDNGEAVIGGVRFLGTTLWTDFRLFGGGAKRAGAMDVGRRFLRDFTRIRNTDDSPSPFTPEDAAALFHVQSRWLKARLATRFDGPTVVITHHAPSPQSIHPRFADSPLNACFVSDAEYLLDGLQAHLWVHGHTHDSFDYVVNGTRVVCNPRGYALNGVNENARFDANLCMEVG
ncbi:MAG TPA: metallophosphoesterase [Casimicrobiaceae bacterium]|nr:metallophosphoesterase [Casimicrobiaceae bacterium]